MPSRISDHSFLIMNVCVRDDFNFDSLIPHQSNNNADNSGNYHDSASSRGSHNAPPNGGPCDARGPEPPRRFKINGVPADFMNTPESRNKMRSIISEIDENRRTQESMNNIYNNIIQCFISGMEEHFPQLNSSPGSKRKFRFTKKEWWDDELTNLFKIMHKSEREYIKAKKNKTGFKTLFEIYKKEQNTFDKTLKRKKRHFQRTQCLNLEEINSSDPTSFWDYIKRLGPKKSSKIPWECYSENDEIICDNDEVLKKWKKDFESLYTPSLSNVTEEEQRFKNILRNENLEFEKLPCNDALTINMPFEITEIDKVISKSKNNKAPGIDGIVYDVLKNENSTHLLTKLFNLCLSSHKVPDIWVQALIYPIPKSSLNDPRIPLNYRGISLLPVISKLYTSALNIRLNNFAEGNDLIVNEQNGFRAERSCLDHIFVLQNTLNIRNQLNSHTFCAFIDFKKAFDYVDREALLYKLRNLGIVGNFYHTIRALYTGAKSCVQVNEKLTDWFNVDSGVRQGDSLSPTLFSLFLNDLATEIKELDVGIMVAGMCLSILLYADDIVLCAPTAEKLQLMLDVVGKWCRKWGMQINAKKSQILHVRNPQRPRSSFQFNCGGAPLAYTEKYKYLGFILHEHLINTSNVNALASAASRSFGRIHSIFKSVGNLGIKTYETLYSTYIKSIMNYASGVWGFRHYDSPQVLQNRIMRFYLGVHKFAPVSSTKIEMDWLECRESRWLEMLRLFNHINKMDENRLPHIIYKWDLSLGLNSWASEIKHIVATLGLPETLNENEEYDLTLCYNKLLASSRLKWQLETERKPKLRSFIQIHDFNNIQTLVKSNVSRYQRSLLTQVKFGILPLKIETDRYQGIPLDERICKLCDSDSIEDEVHFMFHCNALNEARQGVIDQLNLNIDVTDDYQKLKLLLNESFIHKCGKYIEVLYKTRQNILYR